MGTAGPAAASGTGTGAGTAGPACSWQLPTRPAGGSGGSSPLASTAGGSGGSSPLASTAGGSGGSSPLASTVPDAAGHFGPFGGRLAPEALMSALEELT